MEMQLNRVSFLKHAGTKLSARATKGLDPAYQDNLKRYAPIICDFARSVLFHESLKGQQLIFVGRSMDLAFHAACFLAKMVPALRDRCPDLYLIDFSKSNFFVSFPMDSNYSKIRSYLAGCGLNLGRKTAIIDDVFLSGETTILLKDILFATQPFPQVAVCYDDKPFRKDGEAPDFNYAQISAFPCAEIRNAAMFLSKSRGKLGVDIYDPARAYHVEEANGRFVVVYDRIDYSKWLKTRDEFLKLCAIHAN